MSTTNSPIPARLAALDRMVHETALETAGSDDTATLYSVALNLLWHAQRGASPGFLRLEPLAVPVPRIRPEAL